MSTSLTFNAGALACGWLATHLVTGTSEDVPVLYGTLLIETFGRGVRLTATDRTILLTTWVPTNLDDPYEPTFDEAPDAATVIRDPDGRGKALLTYLRKLAARAAKDDAPQPLVTLHIGVAADDEGGEPSFPGMELEQVVIDYPDHERVALPVVQGTFPDYRSLLVDQRSKATRTVNLSAENLARLGQVGKVVGGFLRCTFAGPARAVGVTIGSPVMPSFVQGVVMPIVEVAGETEAAS